ncbi:MAG: MFS transporter [Halobacteriovoraceae bacterium]|jgi:hypothetical protein|nr:MFS transporter [Halobacteriovoraceae bacterium]MBT5096128.1 MFS transporter [Halobacteriovoraceae bacterium]
MEATTQNKNNTPRKKDNPLLNIGLNVVLPSIILFNLSSEKYLGEKWGLILAVSFPIGYGLVDYLRQKKINFFSGLGLFSIIMTGGIGLLKLPREMMVWKETGIPLLMGLAVIISQKTEVPLVRSFLDQLIDLDKIKNAFKETGEPDYFEKTLSHSSYLLGGTFFISAFLNYVLAIEILVGQPGSEEFNKSLAKMTALSFPVITIPMMVMVAGIMFYLFKSITKKTSLDIESVFRQ